MKRASFASCTAVVFSFPDNAYRVMGNPECFGYCAQDVFLALKSRRALAHFEARSSELGRLVPVNGAAYHFAVLLLNFNGKPQ
jgi:hypothetical protein